MSDRELFERLQAGDADAFDAIFRAQYARLVGLAESMLSDRGTAEEITQDVMLELWRRRETLAIETTLKGYLVRAVRNRALNHIRHQKVVRRAEPLAAAEVTPVPPPDKDLGLTEIDSAVRSAVAELPPRCREVFELSRAQGLSYAEIAQTMEISVKTVEAQMGKALRTLRERLAPWLPRVDGI